MNDRPASPSTAEMTAKTNWEAITGSRFGRISTAMTRQGRSPETWEAAT